MGNLTEQDAIKASDKLCDILSVGANSTGLGLHLKQRCHEVCIPDGSSYTFVYHNKVQSICATEVYFQIGVQNTVENVLLSLVAQIIYDPFFNILRTKETLGYIVSSGESRCNGVQGLKFYVQSDRSPDYLDGRIEAFVDEIKNMLMKMTDDEFSDHVSGLMASILEEPKKLKAEASIHWEEITCEQYCFERAQIESKCLSTLTKNDVIDFYNKYICHDAPCRSKLAVYVLGNHLDECGSDPFKVQDMSNEELLKCPTSLVNSVVIKDLHSFKETLSLYSRAKPPAANSQ
jgi:insulysin